MKSLRSVSVNLKQTDPLITLTTDFGREGPFVGCIKGVILGVNPRAKLIDISHDISSYDIGEASYLIDSFYREFPPDTIHLVVVDPGVGGPRRPLLVRNPSGFFIGPDNGVLSPVFGEKETKIWEIDQKKYLRSTTGNTFHGRDLFAPVTAALSTGISPSRFGLRIKDPEMYSLPKPRILQTGNLQGEVIYIDKFGNLITNIKREVVEKNAGNTPLGRMSVYLKNEQLGAPSAFYGEKEEGKIGTIFNSFGYLEIFSYKSNAQEQLGAGKGEPVWVRF